MIFREEHYSEEEYRSVALIVESRGDCTGRNPDGTFGINNDCQEDGDGPSGISREPSATAKERTPSAKTKPARGGGGDSKPSGSLSWSKGQPLPDAFTTVQSSPPVSRSDAGVISSDVFPRSSISSFAGKEFVSPVSCGRHLAQVTAAIRGRPIDSKKELSEDEFEFIASSMTQQARAAIDRGHTPAFYSPPERKTQIEDYSTLHPVMRGGVTASGFRVGSGEPGESIAPEAEFLFRAVQALTSPQASPFPNMQRADQVLTNFFTNPDPEGAKLHKASVGGNVASVTKGSLERLQAIIDKVGLQEAARIFSEPPMRAGDLEKFFKDRVGIEGFGAGGYSVDEVVPIFSVFGPKVGPFFANNTGDYDSLTADVWFTRTWGRLTGELISDTKPDLAKSHATDLLKLFKYAPDDDMKGLDREQLRSDVEEMKRSGEIPASVVEWATQRSKRYSKEGFNKGVKGVRDKAVARLAIAVLKNLASTLDEPETTVRRSNMIKVMREVSARVGQPVAYVQDLLWQDEQDIWAAAGARTATDIGEPSIFSTGIKKMVSDPSARPAVAEKKKPKKSKRSIDGVEQEEDSLDGVGDLEQFFFEDELQDVSPEEFADAFVEFFSGRSEEARASEEVRDVVVLSNASLESVAGEIRDAARVVIRSASHSVWPRLGFDAKIPQEIRSLLPEHLSHASTLLDLHATREGADWWSANGRDVDMELDLRDASAPPARVFFRCLNSDLTSLDSVWEEIWESDDLDDYCGDEQAFFETESRDCGQDDLGRFSSGNDCANDDGSGGGIAKDIPPSAKQASKAGGGSGGKTAKRDAWKKEDDAVVLSSSQSKVLAPVKSALIAHGRLVSESLDYVGVTLDEAASACADLSDDAVVLVTHGDTRSLLGFVHRQEPLSDEVEPEVTFCSNRSFAGVKDGLGTIVSIALNDDGELSLNYALLGIKPEAQKASPVAIAREMYRGVFDSIANAEKIGVKEIVMKATGDAKDSQFKGYRIWPRLGFDGVIPRSKITPMYSLKWGFFDAYGSSLPDASLSPRAKKERAAGSLTIQALYETKEGQDWWEKNGGTMDMIMRVGDEDNPGWQRYKRISRRVAGRSVDFDAIVEAEWRSIREEVESRSADCGRDGDGRFGSGNDCAAGDGIGSGLAREPSPSAKNRTGGWGGGISADFGKTNGSAVFTPERPLFKGAERIGRIDIATPKDVRELLQDSMKMTIADAILASGAVVDSQDRVAISKPRVSVNSDSQGVYVEWHATGVSSGRGYSKDEKEFAEKPGTAVNAVNAARVLHATPSGVVVDADGLEIHPDFRGQGLAMEAVARMASAPVARIKMDAVRADTAHPRFRYTGYSVWPKYGYDAPVSKVKDVLRLRHSLGLISSPDIPKEFASAKTLSDIYATPGGKEWWTRDGDTIALVFDVRPRSRSMLTMLEYQDASRKKHEVRGMTQDKNNHGADVDDDVDVLDKIWEKYQKEGLPGSAPTQDEWDEWDKQDAEIKKKAKDGDSGKVQPH